MWIEKHIIRPYLAFDSVLCEALQHNLPAMVPPPHHPSTAYPLPQVIFRMFDYTDCPEGPILPGQHSIERYLIEEQLKHILQANHLERKDWYVNYHFTKHVLLRQAFLCVRGKTEYEYR